MDRALPLTRGQLDTWLDRETGRSDTGWQLGSFVTVEGTLEPDLLEWAIRRVGGETEPVRAAFFEVDRQVFQRAIDYRDVELFSAASRRACARASRAVKRLRRHEVRTLATTTHALPQLRDWLIAEWISLMVLEGHRRLLAERVLPAGRGPERDFAV